MVAAGRRFRVSDTIRVQLSNPGFVEMRKDPKLVSILRVRGETWVARLNAELHEAQVKRKQPVADGYTHYVHTTGTRARLYIVAFTARAQAHEKKHSSILKLMETSGYDVVKFADLTPQQQAASTAARGRAKRERGKAAERRRISEDAPAAPKKRTRRKNVAKMTSAEYEVYRQRLYGDK